MTLIESEPFERLVRSLADDIARIQKQNADLQAALRPAIAAAERRGYDRAVANLRERAHECDRDRQPVTANWYREIADELEATKETTP